MKYLPNRMRAALAVLGLGAAAGFDVWQIVNTLLIHQWREDEARMAILIDLERPVAIGLMVVLVFTAITFLMWFRRAYGNAAATGLCTRHLLGWAVGAWFVPFVNLVRPAQIAGEMWAHAALRRSPRPSSIVPLWWGFFLLGNLTNNVSASLMATARGPDATLWAFDIGAVASAMTLVSALAGIRFVRQLTAMQSDAQSSHIAAVFSDDEVDQAADAVRVGGGVASDFGKRQIVGSECARCGSTLRAGPDAVACIACDRLFHRRCTDGAVCPDCGVGQLRSGMRTW